MKTRKGPLRSILGYRQNPKFPHLDMIQEVLECGHCVSIRRDIYGETTADKRRCGKCDRKEPMDLDVSKEEGWRKI
jgi:hypothetical protein